MGREDREGELTMDFRYTQHQVARGSRPDLERNDAMFLLKNVTHLRLTYQIRLLTFRAMDFKKKLVIRVPKGCLISQELKSFQSEHSKHLRIEKVQ